MSRGMSRGGGGFPIIIAVLGVLILIVVGIFIYLQLRPDTTAISGDPTMPPTQAPTDIPTQEPTPEVTPEPVVTVPPVTEEPTADPAATATAYVTAPPSTTSSTIWINVDALLIHSQANFTSTTVGKIPYATQVSGDVSGKWMNVSYEGAQGYIYLGKTSAGRACVVYSESALEVLEPDPDAPTQNLVSNSSFNEANSTLTLTITFTHGVYADDNQTGDLQESDFSFSDNTFFDSISHVAGSQTAIITMNIDTGSPNPHVVTLKEQSVFNSAGAACTGQDFSQP